MKISWLWSGNGDGFSFSSHNKEGVDSFQKHKDSMKKFRQAHPKVETSKPKEGIGVKKPGNQGAADWKVIVPTQRVRIARYICN
ncbi:hypothetical protein ACFLXD_05395 [Chloroflexota bacterium]